MNYKTYCIYIITNYENSVFYIGVTNNLERRIYEHKNKLIDGFSKRYNLYKLVYYDYTDDVYSAIQREKQLKKYGRQRKIDLIKSQNPNFEDLYFKNIVDKKDYIINK